MKCAKCGHDFSAHSPSLGLRCIFYAGCDCPAFVPPKGEP